MERINTKTHNIIENVILALSFLITISYILLATFRYIIKFEKYVIFFQWSTFCLAIIVSAYIVYSLVCAHNRKNHILVILKNYFSAEQILLIYILLWSIISCVLNERYGIFQAYLINNNYLYIESWSLYNAVICFLILFPMPRLLGPENAKKVIEIIIHIVVFLYSIFSIACLLRILRMEVIVFPSGEVGRMTEDTRLVLGYHNNLTGMIAMTMLCLCVYMIISQEFYIRVVYLLFGIVHLAVVYLSNSRTVFLSGVLLVIYIIFYYSWSINKSIKYLPRLGISIIFSAVGVLLFFAGRAITFSLFTHITHNQEIFQITGNEMIIRKGEPLFSTLAVHTKQNAIPTAIDFEGTKGLYGMRKITDLGGRSILWKDCLSLMVFSPFIFFFGVSITEVSEALLRFPGNRYNGMAAHAHNSILQIGVSRGALAMFALLVFFILVSLKSLKLLRRIKYEDIIKKTETMWLIIGVLICFLFIGMSEPYLIEYFSVISCFFFLFCGWVACEELSIK